MNWRQTIGVLAGSIVAVYGIMWTFLEVSIYFGATFPRLKELGATGHYLFVLHAILIAWAVKTFWHSRPRKNEPAAEADLEPGVDIFRSDLVFAVDKAHSAKRYEEVIRFGSALDRPLFVSGNHAARLKIGTLVEDAALITGEEGKRAWMLIDAIGWSQVELGDLEGGRKSIEHGLSIAEKLLDEYSTSRAYRHLGAIERRLTGPPTFGKAEEYFEQALAHAKLVEKGSISHSKAMGGSYYALSSLRFHKGEYEEALHDLDKAIEHFGDGGHDNTGLTRSMTKKADALMALGRTQEGRDFYRRALSRAEEYSHRNQIVRSSIGLVKYHLAEAEWNEGAKHLELARNLAAKMNVVTEMKEISELETRLPRRYRFSERRE